MVFKMNGFLKFYVFLMALLVFLGCEKKQNRDQSSLYVQELGNIQKWNLKDVELIARIETYRGDSIYSISRLPQSKAAYVALDNIKINNRKKTQQVRVLVKPLNNAACLGIRMQEIYPNRVDALFDLETSSLAGINTIGEYISGVNTRAIITEDGWIECILEAKVDANYIRLIFGPSTKNKQPSGWESEVLQPNEILIIPSSLRITEVPD